MNHIRPDCIPAITRLCQGAGRVWPNDMQKLLPALAATQPPYLTASRRNEQDKILPVCQLVRLVRRLCAFDLGSVIMCVPCARTAGLRYPQMYPHSVALAGCMWDAQFTTIRCVATDWACMKHNDKR